MRVAVGSIHQEANMFSPLPTNLDDFEILLGLDLGRKLTDTTRPDLKQTEIAGIVSTLQSNGIEPVPVVLAHALPGGVLKRGAYETIKRRLLQGIRKAGTIDGICLSLHGSMYVEHVGHGESDLLASVRALVGKRVLIVVALDLHANVTDSMVASSDGLVTYRTAPHTDIFKTGQRAAELLHRELDSRARFSMAFTKLPILLYGESQQTTAEPMRSLMRLVENAESKPHLASCSLALGDSAGDVYNNGASAIVISDGDQELAQREANHLALAFWRARRKFHIPTEAYNVNRAIDIALSAPQKTVFLSDSGDDPTDGSPSDTTYVLERLLAKDCPNTLLAAIYDPEAVSKCRKAGVGNKVSLQIGGKIDRLHSKAIRVTGKVLQFVDERRLRTSVKPGLQFKLGSVAVLRVKGVDVVLSARRTAIVDPGQLRSLGIEPLEYKLVVLKMGYLFEPLQRIAPRSILVLSPGCTNSDLRKRGFQRVRRPIYPLDSDTTWKIVE